jgi:hypothetical protein
MNKDILWLNENLSTRGEEWTEKRISVLQVLAQKTRWTFDEILQYHHNLLFLQGYPDSPKILQQAKKEFDRITKLIRSYCQQPRHKTNFTDSGLVHSDIRTQYSLSALEKLLSNKANIGLFSIDAQPEIQDKIIQVLTPSALRNEWNNKAISTFDQLLKTVDDTHKLESLVAFFLNSDVPPTQKEQLFEDAEIYVEWVFERGISYSRSPIKDTFFHPENFERAPDLFQSLKDEHCKIIPLSKKEKSELQYQSLQLLGALARETDPVTYAEIDATEHFDAGRGMHVTLFYMKPEFRLGLESYVGYVAWKNGIPLAYGGAWILGEYARIGINIFPWFRGGESVRTFQRLMAVYYQQLGVKRFGVEPYQIGLDNPEGIESGAFWFYYRMGYRPKQSDLLHLASLEWKKIKANKNYRSPKSTLKKLAHSRMLLSTDGSLANNDSALFNRLFFEKSNTQKPLDFIRNCADPKQHWNKNEHALWEKIRVEKQSGSERKYQELSLTHASWIQWLNQEQ